jgi:hypothetical protein
MAEKKGDKKQSEPTAWQRSLRRVALWGIVAALGCTAFGMGYGKLKRHVQDRYATPKVPPDVVLVNRPAWMNEFLAERITAVARPGRRADAFDQTLLVDVHDQLLSDPDVAAWIEHIKSVRRVYGQGPGDRIEVDAVYRSPIALVRHDEDFWLVDSRGVMLPESFLAEQVPQVVVGQDGKLVIRVIDGVAGKPGDPGSLWKGDDLQAALELLRMIHGRSFAQDVVKIDVSNFGGRRDAQAAHIVLVTRYNTQIRWGRPISTADPFVEVSAARKLEYLERIMAEFGQVDARRPWIDIRFDKVTYPKPSVTEPLDAAATASETR